MKFRLELNYLTMKAKVVWEESHENGTGEWMNKNL